MLEFDPNRASIFRCLLYAGVLGDQSKTAASETMGTYHLAENFGNSRWKINT